MGATETIPLDDGDRGCPPDDEGEHQWECNYCKMVVCTARDDFVPEVEYGGPCSRNPDASARRHEWRAASLALEAGA